MYELIAKRPGIAVILIFVAFIIGLAVSAAREVGTTDTTTAATPAPTVTKTVTAEPEPPKTVTKIKTVTKTPKACKTALKLSDELDEQHNGLHRTSGYAVSYAEQGDRAELDEATRIAEQTIEDIEDTRADYLKAATECKEE